MSKNEQYRQFDASFATIDSITGKPWGDSLQRILTKIFRGNSTTTSKEILNPRTQLTQDILLLKVVEFLEDNSYIEDLKILFHSILSAYSERELEQAQVLSNERLINIVDENMINSLRDFLSEQKIPIHDVDQRTVGELLSLIAMKIHEGQIKLDGYSPQAQYTISRETAIESILLQLSEKQKEQLLSPRLLKDLVSRLISQTYGSPTANLLSFNT